MATPSPFSSPTPGPPGPRSATAVSPADPSGLFSSLTVQYAIAAAVLAAITAFALSGSPAQPTAGPTGVRADPAEVYNPVLAGEVLPDGFRQVLPRDAIAPVYDPSFVAGSEIGWPGDAQVIGVDLDGEAKAYPVSFLNGREMVVDEIAGVPILVTW